MLPRQNVLVPNCCRYDYDPVRGKVAFRMPTQLYDTFIRRLETEVQRALANIASNHADPVTRNFASKIICRGGTLHLKAAGLDGHNKVIRRMPDTAFGHIGARWPGVIIEVSYSQKRVSLRRQLRSGTSPTITRKHLGRRQFRSRVPRVPPGHHVNVATRQ